LYLSVIRYGRIAEFLSSLLLFESFLRLIVDCIARRYFSPLFGLLPSLRVSSNILCSSEQLFQSEVNHLVCLLKNT